MIHMGGLRDIRLKIPEEMLEGIDLAIKIGQAATRSDFIRMSVANQLRGTAITEELKRRKFGGPKRR